MQREFKNYIDPLLDSISCPTIPTETPDSLEDTPVPRTPGRSPPTTCPHSLGLTKFSSTRLSSPYPTPQLQQKALFFQGCCLETQRPHQFPEAQRLHRRHHSGGTLPGLRTHPSPEPRSFSLEDQRGNRNQGEKHPPRKDNLRYWHQTLNVYLLQTLMPSGHLKNTINKPARAIWNHESAAIL